MDNVEGNMHGLKKNSGIKMNRARSPPIKGNPKNKSDQVANISTNADLQLDTSNKHPVHELAGTRNNNYKPKRNMYPTEISAHGKNKMILNHHKTHKIKTEKPNSGSGGPSRGAFSTTNPSGASAGWKPGKWSGEVNYKQKSGVSVEEVKQMYKNQWQSNPQSAFQLKNKLPTKQFAENNENNNNDSSFSECEFDLPQNYEENEKDDFEHHMPRITNTSRLELSAAHTTMATCKIGINSAKGPTKRFNADTAHGEEETNTMIESLDHQVTAIQEDENKLEYNPIYNGMDPFYPGGCLEVIKESREAMMHNEGVESEAVTPSPRDANFLNQRDYTNPAMNQNIEELGKELANLTDKNEVSIPVEVKDQILDPLVFLFKF